MIRQNLLVLILIACLLMVGLESLVPVDNTASAGQLYLNADRSAKDDVIESKRRYLTQRIYLPVGPGFLYYDYPLNDSRGHYPSHIGGYIYYGYLYDIRQK